MRTFRKLRQVFRGSPEDAPLEPCPFPPPYRAMLAINSDVEWTRWPDQLALLRECAWRELETSFSFWLYGASDKVWSFFEANGAPRPECSAAFHLARAGLLDSNHAIGGRMKGRWNARFDRLALEHAYETLEAEGIRPLIFSNHGSREDRQNVAGDWADYQEGDLPGSDLYHLDLTLGLGTRFFWCDPDYVDVTTLMSEVDSDAGLFVSGLGRDGNPYLRFRRYRGALPPGGSSLCNLRTQLGQILDAGAAGYTVVYQHLGVERHADGTPGCARVSPLRPDAAQALDRLKAAQDNGDVLVTTTARLLRHSALMTASPWRMSLEGEHLVVDFDCEIALGSVRWPLDWNDLEGWAVPAQGLTTACARLNGTERQLECWTTGETAYFGFPWSRIDMPTAIAEAEALTTLNEISAAGRES